MEKTVRVIDEQGNLLEATYPKRAKGLVKHGRARFVDEQTICLTCPPNRVLEETKMSEYTESFEINPAEILKRIEEMLQDKEHIFQAFSTLEKMSFSYAELPNPSEETVGKARVDAVVDIVKCREETNQKLLDFYISLYHDAVGK